MGLDGNKLPWLLSTSTTAPSGSSGLGPHHEEAGGFGPGHGGSGLLLRRGQSARLGLVVAISHLVLAVSWGGMAAGESRALTSVMGGDGSMDTLLPC
jgi:hypothetical protein